MLSLLSSLEEGSEDDEDEDYAFTQAFFDFLSVHDVYLAFEIDDFLCMLVVEKIFNGQVKKRDIIVVLSMVNNHGLVAVQFKRRVLVKRFFKKDGFGLSKLISENSINLEWKQSSAAVKSFVHFGDEVMQELEVKRLMKFILEERFNKTEATSKLRHAVLVLNYDSSRGEGATEVMGGSSPQEGAVFSIVSRRDAGKSFFEAHVYASLVEAGTMMFFMFMGDFETPKKDDDMMEILCLQDADKKRNILLEVTEHALQCLMKPEKRRDNRRESKEKGNFGTGRKRNGEDGVDVKLGPAVNDSLDLVAPTDNNAISAPMHKGTYSTEVGVHVHGLMVHERMVDGPAVHSIGSEVGVFDMPFTSQDSSRMSPIKVHVLGFGREKKSCLFMVINRCKLGPRDNNALILYRQGYAETFCCPSPDYKEKGALLVIINHDHPLVHAVFIQRVTYHPKGCTSWTDVKLLPSATQLFKNNSERLKQGNGDFFFASFKEKGHVPLVCKKAHLFSFSAGIYDWGSMPLGSHICALDVMVHGSLTHAWLQQKDITSDMKHGSRDAWWQLGPTVHDNQAMGPQQRYGHYLFQRRTKAFLMACVHVWFNVHQGADFFEKGLSLVRTKDITPRSKDTNSRTKGLECVSQRHAVNKEVILPRKVSGFLCLAFADFKEKNSPWQLWAMQRTKSACLFSEFSVRGGKKVRTHGAFNFERKEGENSLVCFHVPPS